MPTRSATWSTGRSVVSSNRRASSTRCWVSHRLGLSSTSSRKRRVKVRTLMLACRARSGRPSGRSRCRSAHARVAAVDAAPSTATGWSMNWAWPPSRCGGTTQGRAARVGTPAPGAAGAGGRDRATPPGGAGPGGAVGDLGAVVAADDVQAQVDARGGAGRGQDVTLVDVEHVGVQVDRRMGAGELRGVLPVRGGAPPVEQARGGEDVRAGADG